MLANKNGKWKGVGVSNVRELEYFFDKEKVFLQRKEYELRIEQAMRYGDVEKEINGYQESTTNNIMELTAVIESLKLLKQPSVIIITTDSTYVKNFFLTF